MALIFEACFCDYNEVLTFFLRDPVVGPFLEFLAVGPSAAT